MYKKRVSSHFYGKWLNPLGLQNFILLTLDWPSGFFLGAYSWLLVLNSDGR